jgi:serine/threonine protein kinase
MHRQIQDEYEIVAEIGFGGMATVYKAVQKSLERLVAIKELKRSYHGDRQIVKRFERESRVAASLQHENIVHVYDYWKKPHYAIVMEYVDGTTLANVIEKTGALPIDVGSMIAIQVGNALDYAHMRGLLHRDIKPSNIMIKRNGEVKLMDFGIAHGRNHEALTAPGTFIGTPSYMSPEQILGQPLDVRSDIFSFGVVLYEMFTGVKPFKDDDARPVTTRIVKDKFLLPRRVNKEIPYRLQWLIAKCLRKKTNRRYESILDVQRKLGRYLTGKTTKARSLHRIADYLVSRNLFEAAPAQETVVIPMQSKSSNRMSPAYIIVSLALLIAAGTGAYYYRTMHVQPYDRPPVVHPAQQQISTGTMPINQPKVREEMTSASAGSVQPASSPSSSATESVEKNESPVTRNKIPPTVVPTK